MQQKGVESAKPCCMLKPKRQESESHESHCSRGFAARAWCSRTHAPPEEKRFPSRGGCGYPWGSPRPSPQPSARFYHYYSGTILDSFASLLRSYAGIMYKTLVPPNWMVLGLQGWRMTVKAAFHRVPYLAEGSISVKMLSDCKHSPSVRSDRCVNDRLPGWSLAITWRQEFRGWKGS